VVARMCVVNFTTKLAYVHTVTRVLE